ncbi:MAG: SDR family oxidoreductase [Gemmatimonadales bacterium]
MILVTGATGYVGGRLVRRLQAQGRPVRCMARRPGHLAGRFGPAVEVVAGDVLDRESLAGPLAGVDTAYYLVHSMGSSDRFERADREGALNFGAAARAAGVRRAIYLGGLGHESGEELSLHLRSRQETGEVLRASGIPVTEFRASIILGAGSLSFEMIRALVERLPILITPQWVRVPAQPIAIDDVLDYLVAGLERPIGESRIFEIGGPEAVSYRDLMQEYARQRGLRRVMIPVPVITPAVSSLWLGLVTPLFARVGRKLIDSIRHPTTIRDDSALEVFNLRPAGVAEAMRRALRNEDQEFAETRWSDAMSAAGAPPSYGGVRFGNRLLDTRSMVVPVDPPTAFRPIRRIGGETGWYWGDALWSLRGWLDLLMGGVGMRRGRRDADSLAAGDVVDCWRVEAVEPDRRLRLQAEMKLPGRAWLTFEVEPMAGGSQITQTATFDPAGLSGLLYWYAIWPLHALVFRGMARGVAKAANG